ncbi:cytochrome c oxidase accessory protein CcoG [Ideonella sp. DXS22W]|uniref:Cytochrome c oxidase accessory protein CcoG n=1 Tax=Pseudaquabacterium inlustre TaxID=2984192 RepID=A0ABU9CFP2_9BURK
MSETTTTAPGQPAGTDDAATAVVSLYVKQKKIYPRAVTGLFVSWRWALVWFTQILFYGVPWLSWNSRQLVLFDLGARRFYIGPLVLYPQDFIFLTAILIISAYALFLFTAVAGRLWCGYACPQTVYTEIYMWIERKIEGDRIARMRLDDAPWSFDKLWRKTAKQAAWIILGLWTGFTFVGYFTPIRTLAAEAMTLGFGPWEWFWVLFYGFATYGNAGFMREQVCKYMCPYARFQSAMFDKDTLIISYDTERGEPRGSRSKKADPRKLGIGDCIDCNLCVQVCPTGIDIRKGLQYECIGCAACVDVCDDVMGKMGYAKGLVRYDTQNGLAQHLSPAQKLRRIFRPRVLVYTAILGLVIVALFVALALRHPFRVDVVRDRASLARMVEDGKIENVYRLQIMNATEHAQRYRMAVQGLPGIAMGPVPPLSLAPAEARWVTLSVQIPPEAAQKAGAGAHPIQFEIGLIEASAGGQPVNGATISEKSTFVVPR